MRASAGASAGAWSAAAATTALAAAAVWAGATSRAGVEGVGLKPILIGLLWAVPGALIASRGPRALGWAMLSVAGLFSLSAVAHAVLQAGVTAGAPWWTWYADRASAVIVAITLLVLVLLPDGRLPARAWRWVLGAAVTLQVGVIVAWSLVQGPAAAADTSLPEWTRDLANPVGVLPQGWGAALEGPGAVLIQVPFLLVVAGVWQRLRGARGDTRRRTVTVLLAVLAFALLVVVGRQVWPAGGDLLDVLAGAFLAATVTASVLRIRLGWVDRVVGRLTVFLVLAAALTLGYAVLVSVVTGAGSELPPMVVGLAAAAVTLGLAPARVRLQDGVDRALYGDARESARVRRLTEELSESRRRLVGTREEERVLLRRQLHDDLGPTLAGMAMQLRDLEGVLAEDPDLARERLARLADAAEGALAEVREMSRALRPPALDELGLVGALGEVADGHGLECVWVSDDLSDLPPGVESAAYRIGREALTNVAMHSGCRSAEVVLRREGHGLRLDVRDRGSGRSGPAGVGTVSMRERAQELGGTLTIDDTDGGGTTVAAWLPLPAQGGG